MSKTALDTAPTASGSLKPDDFLPLTLPVPTLRTARDYAVVILALERANINQLSAFLRQRLLGSHTASVVEVTLDPKCRLDLVKDPKRSALLMRFPEDSYSSDLPPLPNTRNALIGMINQSIARDDPIEAAYFSRDLMQDYVLVGLKREESTSNLLETYHDIREKTAELEEKRLALGETEEVLRADNPQKEAVYRKKHKLGKKVKLMDHLQDLYSKLNNEKEEFDEQLNVISKEVVAHLVKNGINLASLYATDAKGNCTALDEYLSATQPEDTLPLIEAITNPKKLAIRMFYHSDVPAETLLAPGSIDLEAWLKAQKASYDRYTDMLDELDSKTDQEDLAKQKQVLEGMTAPERYAIPFTFELGIDDIETFVGEVIKRQSEMGYSIHRAKIAIQEQEREEKLRVQHAKKHVPQKDKQKRKNVSVPLQEDAQGPVSIPQ